MRGEMPPAAGAPIVWTPARAPGQAAAQPPRPTPGLVARLRRVVTWWTILYGCGAAIAEVTFSRGGPPGATAVDQAIKDLIYALVWAPVLLGAIALTEWRPIRAPIRRRENVPRLVLHAAAAVVAPFAWGAAAYYLRRWAIPAWHPPAGVTLMWANTAGGILYVYGSVVIVGHLLLELQERQRRDASLLQVAEGAASAQLQILLLELHPHFLGNALHAVSGLLRSAPARAVTALRALQDLLASAIRAVQDGQVTLAQEVRTLESYLSLQTLRYGARLQLTWDIPASTQSAQVPAFLLQPLVENAIKHGVEAVGETVEIAITARRADQRLIVTVADTGVGLMPADDGRATRVDDGARREVAPRDGAAAAAVADGEWFTPGRQAGSAGARQGALGSGRRPRSRGGRGLRNVQDRLRYLYGAAASVRLEGRTDRRGAIATLQMPWTARPSDASADVAAGHGREAAPQAPDGSPTVAPITDASAPGPYAASAPTERPSRPHAERAVAVAPARGAHAGEVRAADGSDRGLPSVLPWQEPLLRRGTTWRVIIGWHAAYAVFVWLIDALIVPHLPGKSPGEYAAVYRVLCTVIWVATLAMTLAVAERWPVRSLRDTRRVLAQIGIGLTIAITWGAVAYVLAQHLGLWWSRRPIGTVIGVEVKGAFFAYAVMASLLHLLVNLRAARARDLAWRVNRQRLAEARVRLLALNLQSAGVLDTLDDLMQRATYDAPAADEGVSLLADVLNGYLELAGSDAATAEELAELADALARLASWRRGARIALAWSGLRTRDVRLPHALLWPLVDDAIRRARGGDAVIHVVVGWTARAGGATDGGADRARMLHLAVGVAHADGRPDPGASARTRAAVRARARELLGDGDTLRQVPWETMAAGITPSASTSARTSARAAHGPAAGASEGARPRMDVLTVPMATLENASEHGSSSWEAGTWTATGAMPATGQGAPAAASPASVPRETADATRRGGVRAPAQPLPGRAEHPNPTVAD